MMEIMAWLVYCGVIAAVLTVGAFAWERSARWSGGSARWGWLCALLGSVTLPWLLRYAPARAWGDVVPTALPALPSAAVIPFDAMMFGGEVAGQAGGWTFTQYALTGWALLSVLMLAYVGVMLYSLSRSRRRWQQTELEGERVWVTRNTGPAALGLREGIVVVPSWALSLPVELRNLLLAHEREHVRSGDPRMLFAGLVCTAAMPWNPLVWLQLLRLRNGIELDCDARVLARGADPRSYGSLLLEVGRRRGSSPLVMATFAEPRVFLEERIRRIARWPLHRSRGRAAIFAVVAIALFTTALSARDPLRPPPALAAPAASAAPAVGGDDVAPDGVASFDAKPIDVAMLDMTFPADTPVTGRRIEDAPTFTPMTKRPELRNQAEVQRALVNAYPPLLRDAGIGGTSVIWFFIDAEGSVRRTQLSRSSGFPALDQAALDVATVMQFSPALNRDQRVAVWVEIPIVFTARAVPARAGGAGSDQVAAARTGAGRSELDPARGGAARGALDPARGGAARGALDPARGDAAAGAGSLAVAAARTQTELVNPAEVQSALARAWPPLLRDAGIGGVAMLWFFIDENGRVLRAQLAASSGRTELDQAALSVAGTARFRPIVRDGAPVQVWVELPVIFGAAPGIPYTQQQGEVVRSAPVVVPGVGGSQPPGRAPQERTSDARTSQGRGRAPPPAVPPALAELAAAPTFTPMTDRPELRNQAEVQRALVNAYPPLLRNAGIGGTVVLWVLVDVNGAVVRTQLSRSSGFPALDEAATEVARVFQFSPARNRGTVVPVWLEVPIVFTAQ
jgi:TonB family protein